MTAFYAPDPINSTQLIPGGNTPAAGGLLFCYQVGSSTKQNSYTDATASTARTNPIVLDSGGNIPGNGEVWIASTAKFVLAPSNDTDPPASPYWSRDNLPGVNDPSQVQSEWIPSGLSPTFVSGSSFIFSGDQTGTFTPGRRLKTLNTAGTFYSTIGTSAFSASTTIGIQSDTIGIDSGLSAVSYGILNPKNTSLPLIVSVLNFGAKGDGVTNDTAAWRAFIAAIPAGGEGYLPLGTYIVSDPTAALTITKPITIRGAGYGSLIRCTGAGTAMLVDGTGVTNNLSGIVLDNFAIATESGGGDALQMRLVSRGYVRVWVPSCAAAAFHLFGTAHTEFHVQASTNLPYTAGTRAIPTNGMVFDDDAVAPTASGHNMVIRPLMEGISTGVGLAFALNGGASHNQFICGDGAGGVAGLTIAAGGTLNAFYGTIFESNSGQDIKVSGVMNMLVDVQAFSTASGGAAGTTQFLTGAQNNSIIGGRHRVIQVDSGAVGTTIYNPSTFGGVTDNGTRTQQQGVWDITGQAYLPERIVMPTNASANSGGMWALFDASNKNRTFRIGIDNTLGTNGKAYFQAVLEGTAQIPLQLNPNGGTLELGSTGSDVQINRSLVSLGGGAAPTLGTIGGSGPGTAGQNTWLRLLDSGGNAFWVPVWK